MTITTNSNVRKRVLFMLLKCAALSLESDAFFSTGTGSPAGSQIRNSAHSPANYVQILNAYSHS